jgi:prophage DNA circulation protein
MMARMLGILDNVSEAGVSVFDKAVEILHNISLINVNLTSTFFDAVDNISHMASNITNSFSEVFARIGNVSNALDFYMNAVMNAMTNLNMSANLTQVYDLLNEVLYNFQTPHEWKIPNVIYTYNDTTAPLSTIHASVRVNGSIEATWHSVDDSPQTVAYVDVYYKVGAGTWKLWETGQRDTGSLYFTSDIESLENSSIYWFRVIATDSNGNIESITQLNTCNITYTTGTTYVPADAQAMVQNILVNPLFLIGLAAIICIIIVVAYLERRRRKIPPKQEVYSQQEYQEQTNLPYYEERMNR